jgi:hypothetical protein
MGIRLATRACPLCDEEFDASDAFRDHLAAEHGLEDDEGTETRLEELPPELEPEPELEPLAPATPVPMPPADRDRFEDAVFAVAPGAGGAHHDLHLDRRVLPALVVAIVVQLAAALLALAAVGGDQAEKVTSTATAPPAAGLATATPSPSTTAAPLVDTRNDQARADRIALRASDLPVGWVSAAPTGGSGGGAGSAQFDRCTSSVPDPITAAQTASTDSAFSNGMSAVFGSSVLVDKDTAALDGMSALRKVQACFGDAFEAEIRSGLPRGVTLSRGTFSSLGYPSYGDETITSSMPVTVSGPGGSIPFRVDILAIRQDRAVVLLFVVSAANGLTPAHERTMLAAIAARMAPNAI